MDIRKRSGSDELREKPKTKSDSKNEYADKPEPEREDRSDSRPERKQKRGRKPNDTKSPTRKTKAHKRVRSEKGSESRDQSVGRERRSSSSSSDCEESKKERKRTWSSSEPSTTSSSEDHDKITDVASLVTPEAVSKAIIAYCIEKTAKIRNWMETHPDMPQPKDFGQYPGKASLFYFLDFTHLG